MTKKLQIRNSTADFLVFTKENNSADTIEVRVQDGNVWLTPKAIGQLFDIDRSVVTKHLQNVFSDGERSKVQLVQILHKLLITARPISINSAVCTQSLKVTTIAHPPWENKCFGELFGISGQFTDKNIAQSIYLYCKNIFGTISL